MWHKLSNAYHAGNWDLLWLSVEITTSGKSICWNLPCEDEGTSSAYVWNKYHGRNY